MLVSFIKFLWNFLLIRGVEDRSTTTNSYMTNVDV